MAQPAGGIKEFGKAITAVSAACPENRHALQAKLGIDVAGERQILLPVILHGAEVPGNGGLGNCGSLFAELTTESSARRATRSAMCVDSELMEPKIAHTWSS